MKIADYETIQIGEGLPKETFEVEAKETKEKPQYLEIEQELIKANIDWQHRMAIGTPTTGLVRMEWVMARYGQLMPTNWSHVDLIEYMATIAPLRYSVADAQNIIVDSAIQRGVEWLLLIEHDNVLPAGAFIMFNEYMIDHKVPVVSGLYFTKNEPPEPMIYRDLGRGYYSDWEMGDKVWCRGVPTGSLLIHMSIIRSMWSEAPEYNLDGRVLRQVFEQPAKLIYDPNKAELMTATGTSDLEWCRKVIEGNHFEKAGWPEYQKKEYPFLVDTNIFVQHIDQNGRMFPQVGGRPGIPKKYKPENWDAKQQNSFVHIGDTRLWQKPESSK